MAILGITGHWIDDAWKLHDVVLDAVELEGQSTGINMAKQVLTKAEDFGIKSKILCITVDNAASNRTLAVELQRNLENFNSKEHMLGCIGHVINLAAKAGLKELGKSNYSNESKSNERYNL